MGYFPNSGTATTTAQAPAGNTAPVVANGTPEDDLLPHRDFSDQSIPLLPWGSGNYILHLYKFQKEKGWQMGTAYCAYLNVLQSSRQDVQAGTKVKIIFKVDADGTKRSMNMQRCNGFLAACAKQSLSADLNTAQIAREMMGLSDAGQLEAANIGVAVTASDRETKSGTRTNYWYQPVA